MLGRLAGKSARAMAILGALLALAVLLAAAGRLRWRSATREIRHRVESAAAGSPPPAVPRPAPDALPLPVQRYLRRAVPPGTAPAGVVRIRQAGQFNLSESGERWVPFTATQVTILRTPGFDWDARVRFAPALPVYVRDAYASREGLTEARILGLLKVMQVRGGGLIAEGQLLRFLAEAPWYPMILAPGGLVEWSADGERSARATLRHGGLTASLRFVFGEDDFIQAVQAEARGRTVDGRLVPTPWQGRFWNYALRSGVWVPLEGEVSWVLPSGPHPYWRGRIAEIRYEPGTEPGR